MILRLYSTDTTASLFIQYRARSSLRIFLRRRHKLATYFLAAFRTRELDNASSPSLELSHIVSRRRDISPSRAIGFLCRDMTRRRR